VAGSFQQLAIRTALQAVGPSALPLVADRLTVPEARPNAVAFLASSGHPAVEATLPLLRHKEADVRLAAADVLGKLRAREGVLDLVDLYRKSTADEHFGYLAAIAGIGASNTEELLTEALNDENLPQPQRSQAALGLGRIASDTAIRELWRYTGVENKLLKESSITALQVAGDRALSIQLGSPLNRVLVAQGIHSPLADRVLLEGLGQQDMLIPAASAAHDRPTLVPRLVAGLKALDADRQGDEADAVIAALASTDQGRTQLSKLDRPALAGLVQRRLQFLRRSNG
jgi:HEAT repeat protein